jgi:CubicO group peptidase (beta-lactamase class C family)
MQSRREFIVGSTATAIMTLDKSNAATPSPPAIINVEGAIHSEWETSPAQDQKMSDSIVADVLHAGEKITALRSLVVVRNGFLVAERYYAGASESELLPIYSVTKSVSSLLVGLALKRKTIASLNETVSRLLPEAIAKVPKSLAANVTLEQILSGRSGLDFPWTRFREVMMAPDPVGFVLSLPAGEPSRSGWTYNDAMVSLLSPMLARAEGMELSALATRDLFVPLGIERFAWLRDRNGNAISNAGLALRTRDLAKLAWVMLNDGWWRRVSVLPPEWIAQSSESRGPADWRVSPVTDIGYGYLWFNGTLHNQRTVWGWGYGGQFALFVPSLKLVVATAAISPPPQEMLTQTNAVMELVGRLVQAAT